MDTQKQAAVIGERLKAVREENSMSMTAVGDVIGVTHASISRYESGDISPRRSVIEKFAKYFKVDPLWLLGINEEKYLSSAHDAVRIPIFKSLKPNIPVLAQTDITTYYWVPADDGVAFGWLMPDDSMMNARIRKDDVLLVRTKNTVSHGDIALVLVDGEVLVRKVIKIEDTYILHPENPLYVDIVFAKRESHEMRVLGTVKHVTFEV
jgi:repressor LexA